ncbi:MAG TPA: hypothetical protein VI356_05430 [Myxococcales bacterium]
MTFLLCVLLAVAGPPRVEGRVYEPGGGGTALAQVTLAQGERTQVVRTAEDGSFRFRAFEGDGILTVRLPQGWSAAGELTHRFGPAFRGDVIRAEFTARARRVLHGRLLVAGHPLANARVSAGAAAAQTDAQGHFTFAGLPSGQVEVRLEAPALRGRVELPAGPWELSRDVDLAVPPLSALRVRAVPHDSGRRPLRDWLAGRPLRDREIASIERLAALANLDAGFRLVMAVRPADVERGAQAAVLLQRYLTGPALVPRERVLFAVTELARAGQLELILARMSEPEIR